MSIRPTRRGRDYILVLFSIILAAALVQGQSKPNQPPQAQAEDVVRVNTELVQTDVMVFDKKGRFVGGLKPTRALRFCFTSLPMPGRTNSPGFFRSR